MALIKDFLGLLMCEAPLQNRINTASIKRVTNDDVILGLVSNTLLLRVRGIRPESLCLEIN